jgi:hypothetical protein
MPIRPPSVMEISQIFIFMYNYHMYAKRSWRLLAGAILAIKSSPAKVASEEGLVSSLALIR